jgi:hypothetical protein
VKTASTGYSTRSSRHVTTIGGTQRHVEDSIDLPKFARGARIGNTEVKVNVDRVITVETESSPGSANESVWKNDMV